MSAFYNTAEKKPMNPSQPKDAFLPTMVLNNNSIDGSQKRPWLDDDNRDTKNARTEEKLQGKKKNRHCYFEMQ